MPGRTIILNFHGIGRPRRELEPGEAPFWIGVDVFRRVLDLVAERRAPPETADIRITLDDGNASDTEIAAPELAARGLRATVFPLSDRLGAAGALSAGDLRALVGAGHRVGSHGAAHRDWRGLDAAGLHAELVEARAAIAEAAGAAVDEAAVPFGRYDRRVLAALRAAGYRAVYTSDGGPAPAGDGPDGLAWLRPRTSLRADQGVAAVAAVLAGGEPVARRIRRRVGMAWKRLR